jgi:adenylate cyclase
MIRSGVNRFRRRLDGPGAHADFSVLAGLAAAGFTDYLAAVAEFGVARLRPGATFGYTGIVASWATRRPGGFSDGDVEALGRLMRPLSVSARTALQSQLLKNLADAYLGPSIGEKVLAGAIRRGQGERLRCVVWYADLRGFTRLGHELSPDAYLAMLNRYYDAVAGSAIAAGGEVLSFIGDAVLAVFPFDDDPNPAARAAGAAVDAALAAADVGFGVALAEGEVLFGNVGVPDRLSFTVIGEAVNQVQRMEAHTKTAGVPALATAAIAAAEPEKWTALGPAILPGVAEPVALYARKPV